MTVALLVLMLAAFAPAASAEPVGPPIKYGNWSAPQRISWRLGATPMWFSLGHVSRAMCFIPRGFIERDGQLVATRDGSGHVVALDLEVHEIEAFAADSQIPAKTTLIERHTITPDAPEARKQRRWPFPSEQGTLFELDALPKLDHQTLHRFFIHGADRFVWHTLMVHAQATLTELPAAVAAAAGTPSGFGDILVYTIVCERLNDPTFSYESTYIEPNDPPTTIWIAKERLPAPWALGKTRLEPVNGTLRADADGGIMFAPLSEQARDAALRLAREAEEALGRPKLPGSDGADVLGPERRIEGVPEL